MATISFILALVIPIAWLVGFRLIVTSSVPKGLWFVHAGQVARGQYVLVCLPADIALLGRRAGYLMPGLCPGRTLPVMKRVIALSGDLVAVDRTGIRVNGKLIPDSKPLTRDSRGRPIPGVVSAMPSIVPVGRMWVLGDWFKSWDSRYYGSVAQVRVIGVGTPFITQPPGS